MKKINSIWYGGKVILTGAILAFGVPAGIGILPGESKILEVIRMGSFVLGMLILLGFGIWLAIELHQDKRINGFYDRNRNRKLKIDEGIYECQACGSRKVKEKDERCSVCGVRFQK
ncbi:MAG: hypothetical protein E7256_04735 [Lachnospiraceae bacterium]|nr:hypothetical protein [Lachnospiraceae bacterium]